MLCPRRDELGGASVFKLPDEDTYGEKGVCSYCGSMNPDEFMARVEAGTLTLGPTDKDYKVYVKGDDLRAIKFYFQHLSEEQGRRFVDLHNERRLNFGVPGHFYVLPFFMRVEGR